MSPILPSTPAHRERVRRGMLPLLAVALSLSLPAPLAAQDVFAVDSAPRTSVRTRTDLLYREVHELPGGKLLVLGSVKFVDGAAVDGMARLHADGSLDSSFTAPYPGARIVRCGVIDDGRIIIFSNVFSSSGVQRVLERLLPDGAIDPDFAALDLSAFSPQAVLGLPDGGAYVLSQLAANSMRVLRVLPDGQLDAAFNSAPLTGSFANTGAVGPAGEVALIRSTGISAASVVVLSSAGVVQPAFTGIPANFRANAAVFEPSGALVLSGGSSNAAVSPALIRILPSGARDVAFTGTVPFGNNVGAAVVRLTDGTFMAAGPGAPALPAVAHFSATGAYLGGIMSTTVDGSLGLSGVSRSSLGGAYAYGRFATLGGVIAPNVARIAADRSVDPAFLADIAAAGRMVALARYGDGFLIAGAFNEIGAQDIFNLATFGADDSFGAVLPFFPQSAQRALGTADGGVVLWGSFPPPFSPNPTAIGVLKLRADGTLNLGFSPTIPQGSIEDAVEQPDGRIVFAGRAGTGVPGSPILNLFRTNADGTLDATFNNLSPITGGVGVGLTAVACDAQGRIVVAGSFTIFQGVARPGLARVTPDGLVDPTFAPAVGLTGGSRTIRFLPDGSFYVVGIRSDTNPPTSSIHRFNEDGSLHAEQLALGGVAPGNYALHPDGSIFIVGSLAGGFGVFRLLPSGEIDPLLQCTFDAATNSPILVDDLGRVLVTGLFSQVNGEPHEGIVRLAPVPFDVTPPVISTLKATPAVLGMGASVLVPVTLTVTASDNVDPAPVSTIISVTSTVPLVAGVDYQITGPLTLKLKRKVAGPRNYIITVKCTDASGNAAFKTVKVSSGPVPLL